MIALGSNLGDRMDNLLSGLAGLNALPDTRVTAVSPVYETAPVGGPDNQGPYLNAAAALETALGARVLLAALQQIEKSQHRERVIRWGPRTLDLDILTFGDKVSDDPDLVLPHPRMHERRFVMVPAADIAPAYVHPRLSRPLSDLAAVLPANPGDLTLLDRDWATGVILSG
nr:2-amino-4-hydroxy-6-hydroxymethyldihydropteridine diphosphokinase [Roseibium sp. RKSG952]